MSEFTRTINGHQYRYLSYWDKAQKKQVLMYLGRVTLQGELIVPSGNVQLHNIEKAIQIGQAFGISRKEAWNEIVPVLQRNQERHRRWLREQRSLWIKLKPWIELTLFITGMIAAIYFAIYFVDWFLPSI